MWCSLWWSPFCLWMKERVFVARAGSFVALWPHDTNRSTNISAFCGCNQRCRSALTPPSSLLHAVNAELSPLKAAFSASYAALDPSWVSLAAACNQHLCSLQAAPGWKSLSASASDLHQVCFTLLCTQCHEMSIFILSLLPLTSSSFSLKALSCLSWSDAHVWPLMELFSPTCLTLLVSWINVHSLLGCIFGSFSLITFGWMFKPFVHSLSLSLAFKGSIAATHLALKIF